MPSIEEAWGRNCTAIGAHSQAAVAYCWARGEEMRVKALKRRAEANDEAAAAARALALAVLEETLDNAPVDSTAPEYRTTRYFIRSRIEALGKEGT